MEKDRIIELITQEVIRQVQSLQGNTGTSGQGDTAAGVLLSDMRPGARVADIKALMDAAKRRDCYGVCIPQWFVSIAKETAVGTKQKIATIVGLPGGTNSPLAKYAEIKQAVAAGIDLVLVPVNMDYANAGNLETVSKEFTESITASKGKVPAGAIIEVKDLDENQITETAKACAAAGADMVILSAITGGKVSAQSVRNIRTGGVRVGVIGGISGAAAQKEYAAAGAEWLIMKNGF